MKSIVFIILILLVQEVMASKTIQLQCSFANGDFKLEFPNFKTGCRIGEPCFLEAKIVEKGTERELKTSQVGFGRSSWVATDQNDQRPAGLVNFKTNGKTHRLAIYYCAGDGQTVEAKFFTGPDGQPNGSDFTATQAQTGTCKGPDLTKLMTNDCSSFN